MAMRLRLCVLRNQLPAVNTLWPIPETQRKHTISQLLEHVNAIFPLESGTWGLEHYIVTVGGYECLHYHEIGIVCRDEDEVVIRPLQYAETRTRTLLGRDQITPDGRHLLDGIPFGRPVLRGVMRPEVRIPAMRVERGSRRVIMGQQAAGSRDLRSQTIDEEDESGLYEEDSEDSAYDPAELERARNAGALVRVVDSDDEDDEDSENEYDGRFADAEPVQTKGSGDESEDSSSGSSSEDDDDEKSSEDDSGSDSSSDSSSTDSDSDDDQSIESWNGITSEPHAPPSKEAAKKTVLGARSSTKFSVAPDQSHATQTQSTTSSSLKRKASSDPQHDSETEPSSKKSKTNVVPGDGKVRTRDRNARRRNSNKLKLLKKKGVLPPEANLNALHEWERANEGDDSIFNDDEEQTLVIASSHPEVAVEKGTSTETLGRSPEEGDAHSRSALAEKQSAQAKVGQQAEAVRIEEQRRKLLGAIASGGVDVTDKSTRKRKVAEPEDDEPPEEMSTKQTALSGPAVGSRATESSEPAVRPNTGAQVSSAIDMVPPAVSRRSKLDLASSNRLLYGSLGVRVPKTQEEKDTLQQRLSDRAKQRLSTSRKAATLVPEPVAEAGAAEEANGVSAEEDPEAWRQKLEVSAVECCEPGVTLSTPPFPFYQRWDPQQRRKKTTARSSKQYMASQKRGKKNAGGHVEQYDKYNTDGGGDALEYDDVAEEDEDEYWEEGALLDGDDENEDPAAKQLQQETAAQAQVADDFPALPADLTTLPLLLETDAKVNDYIVYSELSCSAATNWQPSILSRTAKLLQQGAHGEQGWMMQLATRDVRRREYDEDGKRVYRKFEMEGMSDDEEGEGGDERVRTVGWAEMGEVRLLKRAGE